MLCKKASASIHGVRMTQGYTLDSSVESWVAVEKKSLSADTTPKGNKNLFFSRDCRRPLSWVDDFFAQRPEREMRHATASTASAPNAAVQQQRWAVAERHDDCCPLSV